MSIAEVEDVHDVTHVDARVPCRGRRAGRRCRVRQGTQPVLPSAAVSVVSSPAAGSSRSTQPGPTGRPPEPGPGGDAARSTAPMVRRSPTSSRPDGIERPVDVVGPADGRAHRVDDRRPPRGPIGRHEQVLAHARVVEQLEGLEGPDQAQAGPSVRRKGVDADAVEAPCVPAAGTKPVTRR